MNRTEDLYERLYYPQNKLIMGIDEAGRGPICGPLCVACCVLPIGYTNDEIYDSKKLSPKKREELYTVIIETAVFYKVKVIAPKIIDKMNIYRATRWGMEQLAASFKCDLVLSDAIALDTDSENIALIKGDSRSINIAAASILAKVVRDHIMKGYDRMYPEYGYGTHQGYYTKKHKEAMQRYGVKDFYRFSFEPSAKYKKQ